MEHNDPNAQTSESQSESDLTACKARGSHNDVRALCKKKVTSEWIRLQHKWKGIKDRRHSSGGRICIYKYPCLILSGVSYLRHTPNHLWMLIQHNAFTRIWTAWVSIARKSLDHQVRCQLPQALHSNAVEMCFLTVWQSQCWVHIWNTWRMLPDLISKKDK